VSAAPAPGRGSAADHLRDVGFVRPRKRRGLLRRAWQRARAGPARRGFVRHPARVRQGATAWDGLLARAPAPDGPQPGIFLGEAADPEAFWHREDQPASRPRTPRLCRRPNPTRAPSRVEFLNTQRDPAEVLALEIEQFVGSGLTTLRAGARRRGCPLRCGRCEQADLGPVQRPDHLEDRPLASALQG
jgi:hypothetical protein